MLLGIQGIQKPSQTLNQPYVLGFPFKRIHSQLFKCFTLQTKHLFIFTLHVCFWNASLFVGKNLFLV